MDLESINVFFTNSIGIILNIFGVQEPIESQGSANRPLASCPLVSRQK